MDRLLIVANRLPVRIHVAEGKLDVTPTLGGVATALRGPQQRLGGLWLGWPGEAFDVDDRPAISAALAELDAAPVFLDQKEISAFYAGFSNSVLWPLFHSQIDHLPLDAQEDFEAYVGVNRRFAEEAAARAAPNAIVWVHDYQLLLVPHMLRALRPDLRIGFFLHIPFPAPDIFRVLPWRREVLLGMAGADLIGFHTSHFRDHFVAACADLCGARVNGDVVNITGLRTVVGVFPMGVDFDQIDAASRTPSVLAKVEELHELAKGKKIIVGIDRLDYTKGLPRRMLAIDCLLRNWPELRDQIHVIQVTAPSREDVEAYADFKRTVHEVAGRINAELGTTMDVPIHLLHRAVVGDELRALFRAADVMLVTPLRDGMNLVAKEYVASRSDGDGVLVLSELAGAARELSDAVIVNPYDVHGTAAAIREALALPEAERRARMSSLRRVVSGWTAQKWAESFLQTLVDPVERAELERGLQDAAALHKHVVLLVDYDGTLVDIAPTPAEATPSADALATLAEVTALPGVDVYVVSGRHPRELEEWLGDLDVALVAEHGAWVRAVGGTWRRRIARPSWLDSAVEQLQPLVDKYAGALVEEKTSGVAFHSRRIDAPLAHQAYEEAKSILRVLAAAGHNDATLAILEGDCVVEARSSGASKSSVVGIASPDPRVPKPLFIAAGDDTTDEDLFAALPPGSIAVHVGAGESRAHFHVERPAELLKLLRTFASTRRESIARHIAIEEQSVLRQGDH